MNKNKDEMEYDVNKDAWDVYRIIYNENLSFGDIRISERERPYIESTFKYKEKSTKPLNFSGETDFNFSKNRISELNRSRYEHYKKILGNNYEDLLNECCEKHHSKENISIMLQTGNMQGAKGKIGIDRLDVWLLVLNLKFKYNINLLQNHCTKENSFAIENFLGLFDNVYEYANAIYHIDKKLVDDLIESGKTPLNSIDSIKNYMNLAKRFWEQNGKFIDGLNK
ncbi:MAG: hypothetical protein HXL86_03620 [[Eubacterium] sulci]|nr:hypothetical protein [[Eubacterium] sulci]